MKLPRVSWLALTLASCRPDPPAKPPQPKADAVASPPASEPVAACGPAGLRVTHFGWAPADLSALAVFDLDDPELTPALVATRSFVNEPRHGVPIDLAFAVSQWSWQIPGLRGTLAGIGILPRDLVYLRMPLGVAAWVVPLQCDLEQAISRMRTTWRLDIRRTLAGVVASPTSELPFAFDVIFLEGERIALAPAGSGSVVLEALRAPMLSEPQRSPAQLLDQLGRAPVRAVLRNHGLLGSTPNVTEPTSASGALRAVTADAEGVHEAAVP